MVDRDIIYAKVGIIKRCLQRIEKVTELNPDRLEDLIVQDVFVLNLQRAVQAVIDIAAHAVSAQGLGVPQDLKENFTLLKEASIINSHLEQQMKRMVGFRNIAVHEYQNLDIGILKSILSNNLHDLEEFYSVVIRHYGLSEE
ncbi:MAG: DUF86 domain-containing protein [Bacteroidetes bacterium]|nr:DUF86 domain-containing protein [Bacteroidota bacterium]